MPTDIVTPARPRIARARLMLRESRCLATTTHAIRGLAIILAGGQEIGEGVGIEPAAEATGPTPTTAEGETAAVLDDLSLQATPDPVDWH